MLLRTRLRVMQSQRGVSLLELAIVLGVAGLLIGGIWAAASSANEAHRVNQTIEQIRQIVENIRTRYATAAQIPQQDFTTMTQTVATADVFPAETRLNPGGDPAACAVATPCYFVHPWDSDGAGSTCNGGTYCVGSIGNLLVTMQGNTNSGFVLLLRNLPQAGCIKIASRFIDIRDDIGLVAVGFNNGDAALPGATFAAPDINTIGANCAAGNVNSLYLLFRHTS